METLVALTHTETCKDTHVYIRVRTHEDRALAPLWYILPAKIVFPSITIIYPVAQGFWPLSSCCASIPRVLTAYIIPPYTLRVINSPFSHKTTKSRLYRHYWPLVLLTPVYRHYTGPWCSHFGIQCNGPHCALTEIWTLPFSHSGRVPNRRHQRVNLVRKASKHTVPSMLTSLQTVRQHEANAIKVRKKTNGDRICDSGFAFVWEQLAMHAAPCSVCVATFRHVTWPITTSWSWSWCAAVQASLLKSLLSILRHLQDGTLVSQLWKPDYKQNKKPKRNNSTTVKWGFHVAGDILPGCERI